MKKSGQYDDHELQELVRRALSRRQFLGRSAMAAGGLAFGSAFLSACKGKESAGAGGARALKISNWPLYIDQKTTADFSAATGVAVQYSEDVNDNNEFFAKIDEPLKRGQSIDRDVVILTDWMAGRLIHLGYTQAIPADKFPNKANLVDNLRNVGFDPGRQQSVPWLSGMTGLGYNPKKIGRELIEHQRHLRPEVQGPGHHAHRDAGYAGTGHAGDGRRIPPPAPSPTPRPRATRSRPPARAAISAPLPATTTPTISRPATSRWRSPGPATSRASRRTTPTWSGPRRRRAPCSGPTT